MTRYARLFSLRYLRAHLLRSVLAAVAVGAGVALVLSVFVLQQSVSDSLSSFGRRLAGPAPLRVVGPVPQGGLDRAVLDRVEATPGVAAAVPVVTAITLARGSDATSQTVVAVGIDCSSRDARRSAACPAGLSRGADRTLISRTLASRLTQPANLLTASGPLPLDDAHSVAALDAVANGRMVVLPFETAARAFGRGARFDAIYVVPDAGARVADVRARLEHVVGASNAVVPSTQPPVASQFAVSVDLQLFGVLSVFTLGIGMLLMFNVMALSLEDRRRDLAIVSAVGADPRTVVGGALAEAAALGAVGGLIGAFGAIALAHPLASGLSRSTQRFAGVPIKVEVTALPLTAGVVVGALVGMVAAWWPARRATKLDVAAELSMRGLRTESARRASGTRALAYVALGAFGVFMCWIGQRGGGLDVWQVGAALVGLLLTSVGLVLATATVTVVAAGVALRLVGKRSGAGWLGVANLVREPRRTAVTVGAVAAAVGVAFALGSQKEAIRAGLARSMLRGGQEYVQVSTDSPVDPVVLDARVSAATESKISALPGVAGIQGETSLLLGHGKSSFLAVRGVDQPAAEWEILDGADAATSFPKGDVLVGPGIARNRHLRAGSRLMLDSTHGPVAVRVGGVWADGTFNGQSVTMPMPLFRATFGDQRPQLIRVIPRDGITPGQLASEIRSAVDEPGLRVETQQQVFDRTLRDYVHQVDTYEVLQRGLLVVAFIAVLSTLLLVGIQRRRELALLAAIGMEPGQTMRMTISEAAAVGVVGVIIAAPAAAGITIAFNYVLSIAVGFRNPVRLAFGSLLIWGPIAVAITIAASVLPAWRNSHVEVLEALTVE